MSSMAYRFFQLIFDSCWQLLTTWKLPGINLTPAQCLMFILFLDLSFDLVFALLSQSVLNDYYRVSKSREGKQ